MAAKEGPLFNVHGFYFHAEDVPHLCQVEGCGGPRQQAMLEKFPALLQAAISLMTSIQAMKKCPTCDREWCDCWDWEANTLMEAHDLVDK